MHQAQKHYYRELVHQNALSVSLKIHMTYYCLWVQHYNNFHWVLVWDSSSVSKFLACHSKYHIQPEHMQRLNPTCGSDRVLMPSTLLKWRYRSLQLLLMMLRPYVTHAVYVYEDLSSQSIKQV